MSKFEEGLKLIEERCPGDKDIVMSLATISLEPNEAGRMYPYSREVDAYYEDGMFYISTHAKSKKMRQIERNPEVSFSVNFEWFTGHGVAENLGWVKDEKNAAIREKMKRIFAWFDAHGGEDNPDSIVLRVAITKAIVIKDHGAVRYNMDFTTKTAT